MRRLHELFSGHRIGVISAHPDDHVIQSQAILAAREAGAPVREITLVRGRNSTVNFRSDPHFVANGHRTIEGEAGAAHMGMLSNDHLDATDGGLAGHEDELVPAVTEWASHHGIDIFLTLGGIGDHPDHLASAAIARRAGALLWNEKAYLVGALETQMDGQGSVHTQATPDSQALAFGTAALHESQFRGSTTPQDDWELTEGGIYMHPDSLGGLDQYPIRRDASYIWLPPGFLEQTVIREAAYEQP